jgi:hypothetical protein
MQVQFSKLPTAELTWESETSGTESELTDVCFINANKGWIVGAEWYNSDRLLTAAQTGLLKQVECHNYLQ